MMPPPLTGIRVVELASNFAGPSAGMYLADFGANVVKVELPEGDPGRHFPPCIPGTSLSQAFPVANRGKRSAVIDWRTEAGTQVLCRLLERADVLILDRSSGSSGGGWPLDGNVDSLGASYPRLIISVVSPFGHKGPYVDLPAYDPLVQAVAGVIHSSRTLAGDPVHLGFRLADTAAGMQLAHGTMMALLARRRSGQGQRVETSMLHALIAMQSVNLVWVEDDPAPPSDAALATTSCYRCLDGRYITVSSHQDRQWAALCRVLGLQHLLVDPEFAPRAARRARSVELFPLLEGIISTRPAAEWLPQLRDAGVPCGEVLSRSECLDAAQVLANGLPVSVTSPGLPPMTVMGSPVSCSETPPAPGKRAPGLGEHTREVLEEAGVPARTIADLIGAAR
jgi:crotonobetainyl-CoA:carnitine CoA-transferase CaiB-like acyl-CoA transferase